MIKFLRYPILFKNANDNVTTNGIGALSDATKAEVTQEANAIQTLSMEYRIDGAFANQIKPKEVIMVDASPQLLRQKFRIQEVLAKTEDTITVQAVGIASDFTSRIITKDISLPNMSASQCFQALQDAMPPLESIPGVEFTTDITDLANINYTVDQNSDMSAILIGADAEGDEATQSMQALYKGNWIFDNYHFYLLKNPGKYTGEVIKHGRDMGSMENDDNITQLYTGIFPYAKYTPTPKTPLPTDMTQAGDELDGMGTVQYLGNGNLTTYDSPYPGHNVVGSVQNGQHLQLVRKVSSGSDPATMNDDDWYMLSDNSWVDGNFITFDKNGDYIINAGNGQGHTTAGSESKGIIYSESGTATVAIAKIHVYKSPFQGSDHFRLNFTFKKGDRINYKHIAIDDNGNKWYEVGENEWVYGPHLSFSKKDSIVYLPASGKTYVKNGAIWYDTPGVARQMIIKPGYYTILGQAVIGSTTYYKLATNKWADSSVCDFNHKKTTKPIKPSNIVSHEASNTGQIELHDKPGGTIISDTIPANQQVSVSATADYNGESWSQITWQGHTGWVLSSNLDYSGDTDVEPNWGADESSGDDEIDDTPAEQEIYVTLPDSIVYADNQIGQEYQRIKPVDLSQYWTPNNDNDTGAPTADDITQLQSLADAYMKEYRIGQPDPTCTLSEGEVGKIGHADLYDTVGVDYPNLGVRVTAKVISTTWDALGHRYLSKTIGSLPPTYEHLLLQTANSNANSKFGRANHKIKAQNDLVTAIHKALKEEGSDRLAAEKNIAKQIGVINDDFDGLKGRVNEFDQDLVSINGQFDDVQSWIESGGSTVLQFVDATGTQTYKNPTEIRAMNSDGSYMRFNSQGLEYVNPYGYADSAIDSRGNIIASHLTADTIRALTVDAFQINGALYCKTPDGSMAVYVGTASPGQLFPQNGGHAIWVKSDNYISMMSSGQIAVSDGSHVTSIGPNTGVIGDNKIVTEGNIRSIAGQYYTTNSEVRSIIKDMVPSKYRN